MVIVCHCNMAESFSRIARVFLSGITGVSPALPCSAVLPASFSSVAGVFVSGIALQHCQNLSLCHCHVVQCCCAMRCNKIKISINLCSIGANTPMLMYHMVPQCHGFLLWNQKGATSVAGWCHFCCQSDSIHCAIGVVYIIWLFSRGQLQLFSRGHLQLLSI